MLKDLFTINYQYYESKKDLRTDNYFLMGSPLKVLTIIAIYLYFVKKLGPQLMENRKPFKLNQIMMIYNAFQVIVNLYIGVMSLLALVTNSNHKILCVLVDYSYTKNGIWEAKLTYAYYIIKIIDLLDTIFFILRKKYNQITFLHVYHHVLMAIGSYIFVKWMPGGHAALTGILNSFVHVVMYTYYFMAALTSDIKKTLWWKKYITQLQLLQFLLLFIHFLNPLLFVNCNYPKFWLLFGLAQNVLMLILFLNFYYKTYIKQTKNTKFM